MRVRWNSIAHTQAYYVVGVDTTAACVYTGAELTPGTVTNCTLYWAPELGEHSITVTEVGAETFLFSWFTVEPNLSIDSASALPYRFYPYVRDGYKDRTVLRFTLNKPASVLVKVRNAAGRTVQRAVLGSLEDGTGPGTAGRMRAGSCPQAATSSSWRRGLGELRRAVREVVVSRGWVTRRATKERCGGCGPGAYDHSRLCYVDFDVWYDGDVFPDCWGGELAFVAWRFRLPANAFDISKRGVGPVLCCTPGGVAAVGERTGLRTYVVAAGVSGWRSWDIRRVSVSYSYRVRI